MTAWNDYNSRPDLLKYYSEVFLVKIKVHTEYLENRALGGWPRKYFVDAKRLFSFAGIDSQEKKISTHPTVSPGSTTPVFYESSRHEASSAEYLFAVVMVILMVKITGYDITRNHLKLKGDLTDAILLTFSTLFYMLMMKVIIKTEQFISTSWSGIFKQHKNLPLKNGQLSQTSRSKLSRSTVSSRSTIPVAYQPSHRGVRSADYLFIIVVGILLAKITGNELNLKGGLTDAILLTFGTMLYMLMSKVIIKTEQFISTTWSSLFKQHRNLSLKNNQLTQMSGLKSSL